MKNLENLLTKIKLFDGVSKNRLNNIIQSADIRKYKKGDYIFHQGDIGDGLYIVLDGSIDIIIEYRSTTDEPNEKIITTLEENTFFGEICLLCSIQRSASAKAASDEVILLFIGLDEFQEQIKKNDIDTLRMAYNISLVLTERLKASNKILQDVLQQPKEAIFSEISTFKQRLLAEALI